MPERDDRPKEPDTRGGSSDRQSAPPDTTRAEGQEESLKVHGDKLEGLIPRKQGTGNRE